VIELCIAAKDLHNGQHATLRKNTCWAGTYAPISVAYSAGLPIQNHNNPLSVSNGKARKFRQRVQSENVQPLNAATGCHWRQLSAASFFVRQIAYTLPGATACTFPKRRASVVIHKRCPTCRRVDLPMRRGERIKASNQFAQFDSVCRTELHSNFPKTTSRNFRKSAGGEMGDRSLSSSLSVIAGWTFERCRQTGGFYVTAVKRSA